MGTTYRALKADEIAIYKLPRAYEYGLNYYFGTALPEWTPKNTSAKIVIGSRAALETSEAKNGVAEDEASATPDGKLVIIRLRPPSK